MKNIIDCITPGPWNFSYDDNGFYFVTAEKMPSPYIVASGNEGDVDKANCIAISMVPKMLSLIKGLADAYLQGNSEGLEDDSAYAATILNELNKQLNS